MSRSRRTPSRVVLSLWGVAVLIAAPLAAGLTTRIASPSIEVPGSSSELAARNLQQSFGVDVEPPEEDGRVPTTPGLDIARALLLVLPLTAALVLLATRSLLVAVALAGIELAAVIAALGLLVGLPGLAPPHPLAPGIAAAVAGGAAVWLTLASPPGRAGPLVAAGVAACGFLPLLFAPIPALRGMGAAGILGLGVAAAAAATLGPLAFPRPSRSPRTGRALSRPSALALGVVVAVLAASALPLAGLRLDPAGLSAAPPGLQVLIRDPRGLRDEGFAPLYALAQRLSRTPGVTEVRSIATLVEGATSEQAQAFLRSPLGTDPSEPLLTSDARTTRLMVSTAHGPSSPESLEVVQRLRDHLADATPPGGAAVIGGRAAAAADLERAVTGVLAPLAAAALLGTAAAVWLWRRRWQDALAAAAMGGASGVAALSLVTLVLQHGLGTASLLPLAPPLIIAGSVGLGAAAALTTDDYRAAAPAASILAWAVLGGPGPRSLVLGLGASAWLVSLARNMIVDG